MMSNRYTVLSQISDIIQSDVVLQAYAATHWGFIAQFWSMLYHLNFLYMQAVKTQTRLHI